jgi:hypothetical protein
MIINHPFFGACSLDDEINTWSANVLFRPVNRLVSLHLENHKDWMRDHAVQDYCELEGKFVAIWPAIESRLWTVGVEASRKRPSSRQWNLLRIDLDRYRLFPSMTFRVRSLDGSFALFLDDWEPDRLISFNLPNEMTHPGVSWPINESHHCPGLF